MNVYYYTIRVLCQKFVFPTEQQDCSEATAKERIRWWPVLQSLSDLRYPIERTESATDNSERTIGRVAKGRFRFEESEHSTTGYTLRSCGKRLPFTRATIGASSDRIGTIEKCL